MAELIIYTEKIKSNIRYLSDYFKRCNILWSLITKVFSGDKKFMEMILCDDVIDHINSVGDSHLYSLKNLKALKPDLRTIYIRPPVEIFAEDVIRYADISLNTSYRTIKTLNAAAKKAGKIHQVIIMIELGEMREGVNRQDVLAFYQKVMDLSHIDVIGIGSNLGCMYGIEPTYEKLLELSKFKELIHKKFNKTLKFVSGGSSITLPLIEQGKLPEDINHFRIGEAAFFGVSPLYNERFKELHTDTFEFEANIIELKEKKIIPEGVLTDANIGHTADFDVSNMDETTVKGILDFGMLDVDYENIVALDKDISFVGITSDMMVVDLGSNKNNEGMNKYKIGDRIRFKPNYMAVARLFNSKFIDKRFV